MVNENRLKSLFVAQRILDAIDKRATVAERLVPITEPCDDRAVRRNPNWFRMATVFQPDGLAEFDYGMNEVQSNQRRVQMQFIRRTRDQLSMATELRCQVKGGLSPYGSVLYCKALAPRYR
jgi:hypothetical protein